MAFMQMNRGMIPCEPVVCSKVCWFAGSSVLKFIGSDLLFPVFRTYRLNHYNDLIFKYHFSNFVLQKSFYGISHSRCRRHPSLIAMVTSMVTATHMIYNTGGVEENSYK